MSCNSDISRICNATGEIHVTQKKSDLCYSNINEETKNIPEETIHGKMKKTISRCLDKPVFKCKSNSKGDFDITITMSEYMELVEKAAKSFIKLGFESKASIGIIGFNHPAWFISELGGIFAGGIACGIYTTNNAEMCKFILNDCNCQIAVVENDEQLNKVLSILPDVPQLKSIIKYTGDVCPDMKQNYNIPIYTWTEFLNLDTSDFQEELDKRLKNIKPKDCAILIYTSGTTGFPKGVMLSHDNILFTWQMVMEHLELSTFKHSIISYLPLSHVAANMIDIISTVAIGATIYFAQPDALKGSLGKTLKEVRPTIFIAVPRVFEKIQEQLEELNKKNDKGLNQSSNYSNARKEKLDPDKLKKALGLDRCEYIASAAAPISNQTLEYFLDLNIPIQQVYGMSECTGPQTIGPRDKLKIGTVGTLLKGVELKIANPDENLIGEVCMRGRHVFLGYYNAADKTKEALDEEQWLHSGDLGRMDEDEFLIITGRIKELIITAGGENVAPVPIEEKIKDELPFISQAMVVGDHQKFLSCFLTIKSELDSKTQIPNENFSSAAIRSLNEFGIEASKIEHLKDNKTFNDLIDKTIKKINSSSVSRATYVQKWTLLSRDFSINGGELGPTLKMKRPVITNMYTDVIDSMYKS